MFVHSRRRLRMAGGWSLRIHVGILGGILVFAAAFPAELFRATPVMVEPPDDVRARAISRYAVDSPFGFHPARVIGPADPYLIARDLGVYWGRDGLYVTWVLVQKNPATRDYDWRGYDNFFRSVPKGFCLLKNIQPAHEGMLRGVGPERVGEARKTPPLLGRQWDNDRLADRPEPRVSQFMRPMSYLPREDLMGNYVAWVKACVERYDGDGKEDMPGLVTPCKCWQVGNEPPPFLEDYAKLLLITYDAIKTADPGAKVVIAGCPGMPKGYMQHFRRVYMPILRALDGSGFDIFDFHWYGNAKGDYDIRGVLSGIRQCLRETGFAHVPIWITEMGSYSGHPRGFPAQTEDEQAADLFKRYIFSVAHGVEKVFWAWNIVEGFGDPWDNDYFDHTGLIYDGRGAGDPGAGVRKKAYFTYRLMTQELDGVDWRNIEIVSDGEENLFCYRLKKRDTGQHLYALWWDWFREGEEAGERKLARIPEKSSLLATEVVCGEEGQFRSSPVEPEGGILCIRLGRWPMILKAKSSM
jgi:hypothetical protein